MFFNSVLSLYSCTLPSPLPPRPETSPTSLADCVPHLCTLAVQCVLNTIHESFDVASTTDGHTEPVKLSISRLPKVDLIILEGGKCPSVRPSVRRYVRTSVRPSTKSFFDFNEIWYIGRGR